MLFASLASGLAMRFTGVVDVYSQGLAALLIRSEMSAEDLALPKACWFLLAAAEIVPLTIVESQPVLVVFGCSNES